MKPDARYRGQENQLYRVEIHEGGAAKDATFKWSRENGSVTFPVDELDGTWVELASLGSDDKLDLNVGDRVELVDSAVLSAAASRCRCCGSRRSTCRAAGCVFLAEPDPSVGRRPELHPFLRRWDHRPGSRYTGGGRTKQGTGKVRGGALPDRGGRLAAAGGRRVRVLRAGQVLPAGRLLDRGRAHGDGQCGVADGRGTAASAAGPGGHHVHSAPLAWVLGEGSVADLRLAFAPLAAPVPAADAAALEAEARRMEAEEQAARERGGCRFGRTDGGSGRAGQPEK